MRLRELYTGFKSFSYIIFSSEDSVSVEKLLDQLDDNGYRYWFNSKLTPNEKDLREMLGRLKSAAVTILVLTDNLVNDQFLQDIVDYTLQKRTPFVVYIPTEADENSAYLRSILERAKHSIVFREYEQEFSSANSVKQALNVTKGITEKDAARFFESGITAIRDPMATNEMLEQGMKNISYAANHEYAPALNFLGNLALERARNGMDSYSTAVAYFKAAVKLGNIDSIYSLGCMIADGEGFAQNYNVAEGYILLSAMQGITDAQFRFAEMREKGLGVTKNREEAVMWYKKALDGGDRRAYLPLAYRYLSGETVNREETIAAQYFTEAARDGSIEATLMLAKLYRDGVGVKKDILKSENYFRKAAENGIAEAQYEYALILKSKNNNSEAFKWLNLAALEREFGVEPAPEVLYEIGRCYSNGWGTDIDRQSAFLYYHRAALAGHIQARAAVAECYKKGIGVTVNKRASEFYNPKYAFETN